MAENAEGAVVGELTVTDPDAGDVHRFAVDDDRFEVVDGALKLKAGEALDAEAEPEVELTVTATDGGGLTYDQGFKLTVDRRQRGADGARADRHRRLTYHELTVAERRRRRHHGGGERGRG